MPAAETHAHDSDALSSAPTGATAAPAGDVLFAGSLLEAPARAVPTATVARLPVYLRVLHELADQRIDTISSRALAEAAGVSSAQLRKDLSLLGSYGIRGVGYDTSVLLRQIGRAVGSSHDWPVVICGVGNLGTALANYGGFAARGFRIAALVDASAALIGRRVNGVDVCDLADLEDVLARTGVAIVVIATPATEAQRLADRVVACGVTSILNFAGTVLTVPPGVTVRTVDLGLELQILAYHEQRKNQGTGDLALASIAERER